MIPILETPRLRLRPFVLTDAERVQVLAGDARVADTTLNLPHPYPDGVAEEWISSHAEMAEKGIGYSWAICKRESGELMGNISMGVAPKHSRGNVGLLVGFRVLESGVYV